MPSELRRHNGQRTARGALLVAFGTQACALPDHALGQRLGGIQFTGSVGAAIVVVGAIQPQVLQLARCIWRLGALDGGNGQVVTAQLFVVLHAKVAVQSGKFAPLTALPQLQ